MAARKSVTGPVEIRPPAIKSVQVPIVGITPLIVHAWSAKAKQMMLDKQMGKAVPKKSPKVPRDDYEGALYRLSDGRYGFPAGAFKAAVVAAARQLEGLPMTKLRVALFIEADDPATGLVAIRGEPRMREDMVRLESGVADIRYRPEFVTWGATLTITYNEGIVSNEQVVNLVNYAGFGGVGEWRPEKSSSGMYGRFKVGAMDTAKTDA
jgi:hypothetical protein